MLKKAGRLSTGLTLTALATLASIALGGGSARAEVIYCKTVGVPKGLRGAAGRAGGRRGGG